jgi:hypothetical protein
MNAMVAGVPQWILNGRMFKERAGIIGPETPPGREKRM